MKKAKKPPAVPAPAVPPEPALLKQLLPLLQEAPDLVATLNRAMRSRGYLLTVSWYEVADVNQPNLDMQHLWKTKNFNLNDVLPAMRHVRDDWIKTNRPDMDLTSSDGFF